MAGVIEDWVTEALGSAPTAKIFSARHMSEVIGCRLADGRQVVVKARPGPKGPAAAWPLKRPCSRMAFHAPSP